MNGWSWLARWAPSSLSRREQLMAATTVAAVIVFLGLLLDVPSAKRVKALEAERSSVETEIGALKNELNRLTELKGQGIGTEGQAESLTSKDARFSVLMRDLTTTAGRIGVDVLAIRPNATTSGGVTTLAVELKAPFRILGSYLEALEQSGWAWTVKDFHVQSDPERVSFVSARFRLSTPLVSNGAP